MNITTYKYYTDKNQRLAIRAKKLEESTEVIILKCSKKDAFSNKIARNTLDLIEAGYPALIDNKEVHPERILIPSGLNWKKEFFDWADKTFYKVGYGWIRYKTQELRRGYEHLITKKYLNTKIW